MNFKKAIKYEELKDFFESKGFCVTSEEGDFVFTTPFGEYFAISQPWKDSDMIHLDGKFLYSFGLPDFIREWPQGINLYDYLVNVAYPIIKNLKGPATFYANSEPVIDYIKKILDKKGIDYKYTNPADITYIRCVPQRSLFENTIKYKLFSFYKGNMKYGIILKQFNGIFLACFKDDTNTVYFEYPWHSFCPIYKEGEDYVKTTIENFLEFVEQDNMKPNNLVG